MVSTRSKSQLSNSSLGGEAAAGAGEPAEVTSAAGRRGTRSSTRVAPSSKQPATERRRRGPHKLEAIDEEQTPGKPRAGAPGAAADAVGAKQPEQVLHQQGDGPAAATAAAAAGSQEPDPSGAGTEQDAQPQDALLDRMAREIFSVLDGAFGSGSEGSSSGGDEEGEEEEHQQGASTAGEDSAAAKPQEPAPSGAGAEQELRWEPELHLPDGPASVGGPLPQQQRQGAALAKQFTLAPLDARKQDRAARRAAPSTAGKDWFGLPATQITDEVKRDLRLLQLRGAFDPKSFYKRPDSTKFPKHFVMGTVVEAPQDFYSGRLLNRERKRSFAEEVLADPHLAHVRKKRYAKMQDERAQRSKQGKSGRKTDNPRLNKKPRKPKH
eukprot:scaffold26.g3339.t1